MNIRKFLVLLLAGSLLFAGCVLDDDDDDDDGDILNVTSIDQLSIGGYIFVLPEVEYGLAEFIILEGDDMYDEAVVFINGVPLASNGGVHTNATPLALDGLSAGSTVHVSVYAAGDSVTHDIVVPEQPIIEDPAAGTIHSINTDMNFTIAYPGEHDYVAFSLLDQDVPAWGAETGQTQVSGVIDGEQLPNIGDIQMNAYSANTSGVIPEGGIDLADPQNVVLVASIASRIIKFVGPD